jgi:hypothetical protein
VIYCDDSTVSKRERRSYWIATDCAIEGVAVEIPGAARAGIVVKWRNAGLAGDVMHIANCLIINAKIVVADYSGCLIL